jgi:hypothetical protein
MAAVSIKFDNQDKWLPIDYFRSGVDPPAYRDGRMNI